MGRGNGGDGGRAGEGELTSERQRGAGVGLGGRGMTSGGEARDDVTRTGCRKQFGGIRGVPEAAAVQAWAIREEMRGSPGMVEDGCCAPGGCRRGGEGYARAELEGVPSTAAVVVAAAELAITLGTGGGTQGRGRAGRGGSITESSSRQKAPKPAGANTGEWKIPDDTEWRCPTTTSPPKARIGVHGERYH